MYAWSIFGIQHHSMASFSHHRPPLWAFPLEVGCIYSKSKERSTAELSSRKLQCVEAEVVEYRYARKRMDLTSGVSVSPEVLNEMLAVLAYDGTGNKMARENDASQQLINWPTRERDDAEEEALKAMDGLQDEIQPAREGVLDEKISS